MRFANIALLAAFAVVAFGITLLAFLESEAAEGNVSGKSVTFEELENKVLISEVDESSQGEHFDNSRYFAVKDRETYRKLFADDAAEIDFSHRMVIAVFQGAKPTGGYAIEVNEIIETDSELYVYVSDISPGSSCIVTQAFTYPYYVVEVPKTDKDIEFVTEKIVQEC